jgi:hypothetical protein
MIKYCRGQGTTINFSSARRIVRVGVTTCLVFMQKDEVCILCVCVCVYIFIYE